MNFKEILKLTITMNNLNNVTYVATSEALSEKTRGGIPTATMQRTQSETTICERETKTNLSSLIIESSRKFLDRRTQRIWILLLLSELKDLGYEEMRDTLEYLVGIETNPGPIQYNSVFDGALARNFLDFPLVYSVNQIKVSKRVCELICDFFDEDDEIFDAIDAVSFAAYGGDVKNLSEALVLLLDLLVTNFPYGILLSECHDDDGIDETLEDIGQRLFLQASYATMYFLKVTSVRVPRHALKVIVGPKSSLTSVATCTAYFIMQTLFVTPLAMIQYRAVKERLIGIEENPGPTVNSSLLMRGCDASTRKSQLRKSNKEQRLEEISKTRVKRLHKELHLLKHAFQPEGMFGVQLDSDTRSFLQGLMNELRETIATGMDIRVDFTSNLTQSFTTIMEKLKENFSFLYQYVRFVFGLFLQCLDEGQRQMFSFIAELLVGFKPEAGIVGLNQAYILWLYRDTLAKVIGEGDFLGLSKILSKLKTENREMENGFNIFVSIVKDLTHNINTWFGTNLPIMSGDDKLDGYFERYYNLKREFSKPGCSLYHVALGLYALQQDVEIYYRSNSDGAIKDKIMYLLNVLKPIVSYCESAVNPNNGPRIEPLAILITGPSGVGKSSFTTPLLLALLSRVLPKERLRDYKANHNDFLFFRANENDYWDGYRSSHEVIVFDDFGQKRDVAGGDNPDAFEIIRLKNTAPYHLHFAGINDKQKNYANPRMLYATTNRNALKFHSIVSNEAVIRRFDMAYCQVPKVEFCIDGTATLDPWSRRLDMDKVRARYPYDPEKPETYLALDVVEFIQWDFENGLPKSGGKTLTFHEFYEEAVKIYHQLNSKGDVMLKYHEHIKNRFMPEGGIVNEGSFDDGHSDYQDCEPLESKIKQLFDSMTTEPKISHKEKAVVLKITAFVSTCLALKSFMDYIQSFFAESHERKNNKSAQIVKNRGRAGNKDSSRKIARSRLRGGYSKFEKNVASHMRAEAGDLGFMTKILKRNLYELRINSIKIGAILFIRGRTFMMPLHYEQLIEEDLGKEEFLEAEFVNMATGIVCYRFDWREHMHTIAPDYDLMLCQMKEGFREHSDITKSFPSGSSIKDDDTYKCFFPVVREANLIIFEPEVKITGSVEYYGTKSNKLTYYAPTMNGDCGSPLISFDRRFNGPVILGIHTAGRNSVLGNKQGVGVLVTREELSDLLDDLGECSKYVEEFNMDNNFLAEGFNVVRKAKAPRRALKSKIQKSPLYGKLWETTTIPAKLDYFQNEEGEIVNPAKIAHDKYCHVNPLVQSDILDEATNIVQKWVIPHTQTPPWMPRLLTFEEAIAGVDGVDFVEPVARSTSAGYPHVLNITGKGKSQWLGKEGKVDFSSEGVNALRGIVFEVLEKAKRGIRSEHIYMDCLKDERRPYDKVMKGKTRQFMACPVQYLVLMKMYFGDFIRHINQNRIYNGVAVGINHSEEWHDLATFLKPNSDYRASAGDYASFDVMLPTQVMWKFLEIAENFYSPTSTKEDVLVRKILFHEIVDSLHIDYFGNIYEIIGGNPSGQPTTADANSVCNLIMLVSAGLYNGAKAEDFKDVRMTVFGDDHVVGYPSRLNECFCASALSSALKELYGYEYTDELKSGVLNDNRVLEDVTFLKRGFKVIDGLYRAPLDIGVLKETMNWCKNTSTKEELCLRAEQVCVEFSLHGKEIFQQYAPKLMNVVRRELGYTVTNSTFERCIEQDVIFSSDV